MGVKTRVRGGRARCLALAVNLALHPDKPDGGEDRGARRAGGLALAVSPALHPDEAGWGRRC